MVMNRADPDWATITCNLACGQVLMVDGMAGPASRSAPMRFAGSVCIQTNPPRSFAGRSLRPGGMPPQNAKYDDRRPRGTPPVHRDGILTRAAVLKQALVLQPHFAAGGATAG
jgi:hypothetical protein